VPRELGRLILQAVSLLAVGMVRLSGSVVGVDQSPGASLLSPSGRHD
jgi:hypothetical protein